MVKYLWKFMSKVCRAVRFPNDQKLRQTKHTQEGMYYNR
jgi:hypothetical protein